MMNDFRQEGREESSIAPPEMICGGCSFTSAQASGSLADSVATVPCVPLAAPSLKHGRQWHCL
jgi:hypothetical protein